MTRRGFFDALVAGIAVLRHQRTKSSHSSDFGASMEDGESLIRRGIFSQREIVQAEGTTLWTAPVGTPFPKRDEVPGAEWDRVVTAHIIYR